MIINFIQDAATRHNNDFFKALVDTDDININLWYAEKMSVSYYGSKDLINEVVDAKIYKDNTIDFGLINYVLQNRNEKFIIIGWANITTKFLMLLLWIFRKKYYYWTDFPNDSIRRGILKNFFRELYYNILKNSKSTIFCVGQITIDYFLKRNFPRTRLVNLPIMINLETQTFNESEKIKIREKYLVRSGQKFLFAGSRLEIEKGYDILIEAVSRLSDSSRSKFKLVIAGDGSQKENLSKSIAKKNLTDTIIMENWMDNSYYLACIASCDCFIHPARFDAYGGSLFSVNLGIPTIGSYQAGAARELIVNGENGFLYEAEDVEKLKGIIQLIVNDDKVLYDLKNSVMGSIKQNSTLQGVKIIKDILEDEQKL